MSEIPLYAKSERNGETPPTVAEHATEVLEMARAIWEQIEQPLSDSTKIPVAELQARIRPLYFVAAVLHDFMKANSSFQEMLEGGAHRLTQPVRHEILAALQLAQHATLNEWLTRKLTDEQLWAIIWDVGGHHFQMRRRGGFDTIDPLFRSQNVPRRVTLYLGHPQVEEILHNVQEILEIPGGGLPELSDSPPLDPLNEEPDGLEASVRRLVRDSEREWKRLQRDPSRDQKCRDLAILKVLLIAADIAGSALPRSAEVTTTPKEWIAESLGRTLAPNHLQKIVDENLDGKESRQFQKDVAASKKSVTVVTAGCGNGKTTAAYMWAKKWAVGRKLFFTYPTTGTASAGFADYLFTQTDLERDLIHGRSAVDLKTMWESSDIPPIDRAQRLESLNAWGQQAIACTVDTVLGLIQNQRRPVFAFPAIVNGAFVFDEIHSYDRRLFAELLRFLKVFPGVPVLIMSASIPPNRLEHLKRVAGDRMNPKTICGDQRMERVLRYTLHDAATEQCWDEMASVIGAGQPIKVLWVCNTVKDAVDAYDTAVKTFPGVEVLLYHSRYRYSDRVDLQQAVIAEFRYEDDAKTVRTLPRPAIAITTQVCEMSLDISADILVSALCPLPSLVQRLGRLNRYTSTDDPNPAYIFPFSGRPYHEHDATAHLDAAAAMIADLAGEPCSQEKLSEYIDALQSNEELPEYSAWLDGGWQSEPLPAREGDNSLTVVREEDLTDLKRLPNGQYRKDEVIRLTIPMLFKRGFDWNNRAAGYPIAPAGEIEYDWNAQTTRGKGAAWASKAR